MQETNNTEQATTAPVKAAPPVTEYQVAAIDGLVIQCPRGKLRPGDPVVPSDVGGGAVLAGLVASGKVRIVLAKQAQEQPPVQPPAQRKLRKP